jgi:hypothetical protein
MMNANSTGGDNIRESINCTNKAINSSPSTMETTWQYLKLDADDNATILTTTVRKDLQSEKPQLNINLLMTNANGDIYQRHTIEVLSSRSWDKRLTLPFTEH